MRSGLVKHQCRTYKSSITVERCKGKQVILRVMLFMGVVLLSGLHGGESGAQETVYRLDSGDEVRITVFGHEDLSGEYIIGGDGAISFPLVGQVQAKDVSARELEAAIVSALKPAYLKNPSVSIEVLTYRPFYILGEVNSPGSYSYVSGMKVVNAVALGGGYTYRAKESKVFIDRSGDEGKRIVASPDTPVFPGDIIHVPERFF